MRIMDPESPRFKEKQVRVNKIINKLRLKQKEKLQVNCYIPIIKIKHQPHPYYIMEQSLSMAIRYAMFLKISKADFINLIKSKIEQELAKRKGHTLILKGTHPLSKRNTP